MVRCSGQSALGGPGSGSKTRPKIAVIRETVAAKADGNALVPDGNTVRLPESFLRAEREGRRFQPHTDWTYVSRNTTGDDGLGGIGIDVEFGGPRMYLVGSRIFIVDRTTAGERHRCIDLLRCEQSVESGCRAFAYKFARVIFTYGQHTHE